MSTFNTALPLPEPKGPSDAEPRKEADTAPSPPSPTPASETSRRPRLSVGARLRSWVETLQRDPDAETRDAAERRRRLLSHLTQAVAEAPEDTPIRDVIRRLNSHWDD